jgi:hypothetical protein
MRTFKSPQWVSDANYQKSLGEGLVRTQLFLTFANLINRFQGPYSATPRVENDFYLLGGVCSRHEVSKS